jgi:hypothetical protein
MQNKIASQIMSSKILLTLYTLEDMWLSNVIQYYNPIMLTMTEFQVV